jgi:hypothetical protein
MSSQIPLFKGFQIDPTNLYTIYSCNQFTVHLHFDTPFQAEGQMSSISNLKTRSWELELFSPLLEH